MEMQKTAKNILEVRDLHTHFNTNSGLLKAVNGVSFALERGEKLGIVGESASGKSVTNLSILKLVQEPPGRIAAGEVLFMGRDMLKMSEKELRSIRGNEISMIFQDPMTSLNPFLRISTQMLETILTHENISKSEAREKAISMLKRVGLPNPEKWINSYPHQFSGGMRQRVMIAMALSCNPSILIADEPTTALDVTIQAQILEIIKDLSSKDNTSIIMITHDMGVVAELCDNVCVMYAGRIVERASVNAIFEHPKHPYTVGLQKSIPRIDMDTGENLYSIPGQPPIMIDFPDSCPYAERCEQSMDKCSKKLPPVFKLAENQEVACWLYEDSGQQILTDTNK